MVARKDVIGGHHGVRRPLFEIAVVLMLVTGPVGLLRPAGATDARTPRRRSPDVSVVTDHAKIQASATDGGASGNVTTNKQEATDFSGTFQHGVTAADAEPDRAGTAASEQTTKILTDVGGGISVTEVTTRSDASGVFSDQNPNDGLDPFGIGTSDFSITLEVSGAVGFHLSGTVEAHAAATNIGCSTGTVTSPSGTVTKVASPASCGAPESLSIDETGQLQPGTYTFSVSIDDPALGPSATGGHADGAWDLSLAVGPCTIFGTPGDDTLSGTSGDDTICGLAGNDTIDGSTGNDTIDGGAGDDTIDGGDGVDAIQGGDGNDTIDAGTGDDLNVDGGPGDDTVHGGVGNDGELSLQPIGGSPDSACTFTGGPGNDQVFGDDDTDCVSGGPDGDTVVDGGTGGDSVAGDGGNDIAVRGGDDNGEDSVDGGPGNDNVSGGPGNDLVAGDSGNDDMFGDAGDDTMTGNGGDDFMEGGDDNDTMNGGPGSDKLHGLAGKDTLIGETRKDVLNGGDDNDTLIANDGVRDVVIGGRGIDKAKVDPVDDVSGVERFI